MGNDPEGEEHPDNPMDTRVMVTAGDHCAETVVGRRTRLPKLDGPRIYRTLPVTWKGVFQFYLPPRLIPHDTVTCSLMRFTPAHCANDRFAPEAVGRKHIQGKRLNAQSALK
jgi:hypothetical protein